MGNDKAMITLAFDFATRMRYAIIMLQRNYAPVEVQYAIQCVDEYT